MQVLYGCKLHLEQDKTVYEIKKLQNSINNSIITKDFGKEDLTVAHTAEKKLIAQNRKAFHDYFVDERYEAGIELLGTEVKSIRRGAVNLKDSYCQVKKGELFAIGMHISPYEQGNIFNHEPLRDKKLLMHKKEILKLHGYLSQKGLTLIPLSLYFSGSNVKMELGLCRGKKLYDKRDAEAQKQANRDIDRHMRDHRDDS
ncbi:MAG: SsrA-binding protein SmpB [Clostridia bacterium]|nr:SsrA-binding protein SmpB [Clostridia bacterium]